MTRAFVTDDGCTVAFDYQPLHGRPVLLLSPSLGTAMALFEPQVQTFASRFSLLRYDPRGHGASGTTTGGTSLDRLGRDVIGLLDHLEIDRAHFLGVSLGGMVGQWLGIRHPERLLRLVLANTSAYMGPPANWAARIAAVTSLGMKAVADAVIERWFTADFCRQQPAVVRQALGWLLATDPQGYAACCAAIRDMDLRPATRLITVPTLVVAGLHDQATPPDHARFLVDSIAGAQFAGLEAAHLANLEQSAAFNTATAAFLDGRQ